MQLKKLMIIEGLINSKSLDNKSIVSIDMELVSSAAKSL
jgi:hypothetical protein